MSRETSEWLNQNTLIGFTDKRGHAWHYRASDQGDEPNHYPDAIPVADVKRRLFGWSFTAEPVYVRFNGEFIAVPNTLAQVRDDNGFVAGIHSDNYVGHGYGQFLVSKVENILDDTLSIGSAGLLMGGAVGWVSVEVPENITTPEGVAFRPNLLAVTSFNGKYATTYKPIVTCVVCDNTLSAGLSESGEVFKAKHTKNSGFKISAARDALGIVHTIADDFTAEVKQLCETTVTDKQWASFLDAYDLTSTVNHTTGEDKVRRALTMAENARGEFTRLYRYDQRCAPWSGTAFGVLQTANTYAQHYGIVRNAAGGHAERNMLNAIGGKVDELDAGTLDTLNKVLVASN